MKEMIYTCATIVISKEGKILICHPTNGLKYSLPKGLPDEGEEYIDAAVRELYEETSISLSKDNLQYVGEFKYPNKQKTVVAFVTKLKQMSTMIECDCQSFVMKDDKPLYPEVNGFLWVDYTTACQLLHLSQIPAIEAVKDQIVLNDPRVEENGLIQGEVERVQAEEKRLKKV